MKAVTAARKRLFLIAAACMLLGFVVGHAAASPRPAGWQVNLTPVTEVHPSYCVPASATMFLQAFGFRVSEEGLATQMGVPHGGGVDGYTEMRVLTSYLRPRRMAVSSLENPPAAWLQAILTAQLRAGHPVLLSIWMNRMPYDRPSWTWAHQVIATGIRGSEVTVFDPEIPSLHEGGGWHVVTVAQLDQALLPGVPSVFAAGRIGYAP